MEGGNLGNNYRLAVISGLSTNRARTIRKKELFDKIDFNYKLKMKFHLKKATSSKVCSS